MIQIKDVAERAGVSITTVSRVVNDTGYPVSKKARDRVLKAVEELHYIPNRSAQALRQSRKNGIALLVRDIANSYFSEIIHGVTETGVKNGTLTAIFTTMRNPDLELKYYDLIVRQQYDGLIIAGGAFYDEGAQQEFKKIVMRLGQQGCKVVALAPQGFSVPTISVDNMDVGYKATDYLIRKGHKKIAFLGGYENHLADNLRMQGYSKALKDNGLEITDDLLFRSDYSIVSGYEACSGLIAKGIEFSAIFASNDHIALGAISSLREHGISVPQEVSVIGSGGFYHGDGLGPEDSLLTTVEFPFYQMGQLAVEYLLDDEDSDPSIILGTKIVEKGSVSEKS